MRLFLLENESSVATLIADGRLDPAKDVVVAFNYLVCLAFARAGYRGEVVFCEVLLDRADYRALHQATDRICMEWFLAEGADITAYEGVSLGDLAKGIPSRLYMFSVLVKYGELTRKALERWPGAQRLCHDLTGTAISAHAWEDDGGDPFDKQRLVALVAEQRGVAVEFMPPPRPMLSAFVARRGSKAAPTRGLRGWVRATAKSLALGTESALNVLARTRRRAAGHRVYIYPYHNLTSVLTEVDGQVVLNGLGRGGLSWRRLTSGSSYVDFDRVAFDLDSAAETFLAGLQRLLPEHLERRRAAGLFVVRGIDYFGLCQPIIAALARTTLRELLLHIGRVRQAIREFGLTRILLNDTLDEKKQAVIAACRIEGAESIFVDHGIMGQSPAQRAADRAEPSMVVTPGSYDPYHHRSATVALGNPSLDPYPATARRKITSLRRILFLTFEDNFYARLDRFPWQERYYEEILATFPILARRGLEVWYKPHPGESPAYHDHLFRFFGVPPDVVRNVQRRPFAEVVREVDLVVSNVTSCFFEAQAAGVPTIFMEPGFHNESVEAPLNGRSGREVLRVESGAELVALIAANQADASRLAAFVEDFLAEHGPLYLGPLDGRAGRRIVDYVCSR